MVYVGRVGHYAEGGMDSDTALCVSGDGTTKAVDIADCISG